jgi:hypothetical protein
MHTYTMLGEVVADACVALIPRYGLRVGVSHGILQGNRITEVKADKVNEVSPQGDYLDVPIRAKTSRYRRQARGVD